MAVVIGIRGPSGSGKTTLIERLIPRLQSHGLRVGVIKHAHEGFTVDQHGKDSWRAWQAGAQAVLVASPQETLMRQRGGSVRLQGLLAQMSDDLDCILVEGFARCGDYAQAGFDMGLRISMRGVGLNGRLFRRDDIASIEQAILDALRRKPIPTTPTRHRRWGLPSR